MIIVNSRFLTQKMSGVQRYAIEMAKQLKALRPDIKFVAPHNIIHGEIANKLKAECFGKFTGHLWEQIELPRFLKNQGENALLLSLANSAPLFYRNKIIIIYDVSFFRNPKWASKKFYYYYRFLIPRIARNARLVITVSKFSKKEILHFINIKEEKIKIVYGAVSPKFLNPDNATYTNKYGKYILGVSSQAPSKNFGRIVKSFKRLDLPDLNLIIVGETRGNYANNKINELIENNPRIFLLGHIDDSLLINLYKNAELFIFPSLYEGFGLPPIEAMASGCPTIVSNAASLPEICGEAALYCNPYDVDDITKKILKVLNNEKLRAELVTKGFERLRLFNWGKAAKTFLSIVEDVVAQQ